jgi:threonylcarbamoyladenosine tRNA methylthiotransferase MtaB
LLLDILNKTAIARIRLSSVEVSEIDDELLEILASSPRFLHHFHLPLQAGSDKILALMKRKYNTKQFLTCVKKIYECFEDANITTDVIVGFPSEDEEDFNKSLKILAKAKISKAHVFPYSRRARTIAADLENQVSAPVKSQRVKQVEEYNKKMFVKLAKKMLKKRFNVLIESVKEDKYIGFSDNYFKVAISAIHDLTNQIVNVEIVGFDEDNLRGKLIESQG